MEKHVNMHADVYNQMELGELNEYANKAGLEENDDLKAIDSYLHKASHIIELGSGNGRVIDYILNNHSPETIFGFEAQKQWSRYLKQKYAKTAQPMVVIENKVVGDSLATYTRGDLVLAPWFVTMDNTEQGLRRIVRSVRTMLGDSRKDNSRGGHFLVDLPQSLHDSYADVESEKLTFETKHGRYEARLPCLEEFIESGLMLYPKLTHKETIPYKTTVGYNRRWEVFESET